MVGILSILSFKQGWQHCGCGQCHPNPLCHLRGRWPPALVKSPILIFVSLHSLIFAAPPGSTVPITWGNQVTLPLEDESSMSVISRLLLLWTQFCIEFTAIPGSQCGCLHWGRGLCEEDWVRVGILSLGGGLLVHHKSGDQGNCSLLIICWVNPVLRCESITNFPNGIDISDAGDILIGDSHGNRFWLKLAFLWVLHLANALQWRTLCFLSPAQRYKVKVANKLDIKELLLWLGQCWIWVVESWRQDLLGPLPIWTSMPAWQYAAELLFQTWRDLLAFQNSSIGDLVPHSL